MIATSLLTSGCVTKMKKLQREIAPTLDTVLIAEPNQVYLIKASAMDKNEASIGAMKLANKTCNKQGLKPEVIEQISVEKARTESDSQEESILFYQDLRFQCVQF